MAEDDRQLWLPEPPKIYIGELSAPARYVVTTGYDDLIAERTDEFFNDVLAYLKYSERAVQVFTERKEYHLVTRIQENTFQEGEEQYIRLLIAMDYLTASVITRRNDWNKCEVSSAHYLTPELVKRLQEGIVS